MHPVDRSPHRRRPRHRAVFVALTLALLAPAAAAQTSPAVDLLRRARSSGARARAAQAIGRLRPADARPALESALDDHASAVRVASAQALEALGDPAAVPAIDRHAFDSNSHVRDACSHALRMLRARLPPVAPASAWTTSPAPLPAAAVVAAVDWRRVRVLITLGNISNHATVDATHVVSLREALRVAVSEDPRYAIHPGRLPSEAAARLRSGDMRSYSLEGGLVTLRQSDPGGNIAVRAEVSLVLLSEPAHSIAATLAGAGTAQEAPPVLPNLPDPLPRLRQRAIAAAAHGALRELESQLLSRRASL